MKEIANTNQRPSFDEGGKGNDHLTTKDLGVPYIVMLQNSSEPVINNIEGARAGIFWSGATNEPLGSSIYIIPVFYKQVFNVKYNYEEAKAHNINNNIGSFDTLEEAKQAERNADPQYGRIEINFDQLHSVLLCDSNGALKSEIPHMLTLRSYSRDAGKSINNIIMSNGNDRWSNIFKLTIGLRTGTPYYQVESATFVRQLVEGEQHIHSAGKDANAMVTSLFNKKDGNDNLSGHGRNIPQQAPVAVTHSPVAQPAPQAIQHNAPQAIQHNAPQAVVQNQPFTEPLPPCPQDLLKEHLPGMIERYNDADTLIATLSKKYTVSETQKNYIIGQVISKRADSSFDEDIPF